MKARVVVIAVLTAIIVSLSVPAVWAVCSTPRSASTYNPGTLAAAYWHAPSGDSIGTLIGQAWQLGAPATFRSDGGLVPCNTSSAVGSTILYFGPGGIGSNWELASCGAGCPAAGGVALVTLAQKIDPTGVVDFLVDTVVETPGGAVNFDYSSQGDHQMIRLPSPMVLSASRDGSGITFHIAVPSIAAGLFGPNAASAVSGYRIVSVYSVSNPGTDASTYTATVATIQSPGGTGGDAMVSGICSDSHNALDQWLATQLVFEDGTVLSAAVSAPRRIHCGSLAEPKYKSVPKKGPGIVASES